MTLRDIMQLLEDRIFFATVLSHSTVAKKFGKISCQIPEPLGCTVDWNVSMLPLSQVNECTQDLNKVNMILVLKKEVCLWRDLNKQTLVS